MVFGRILTKGPIQFYILKEEHGIGIGDSGSEQALGIIGIRWNDNFEAGGLHKNAFQAVRMQFGCAHTTTIRSTYNQGASVHSNTAGAYASSLSDELAH